MMKQIKSRAVLLSLVAIALGAALYVGIAQIRGRGQSSANAAEERTGDSVTLDPALFKGPAHEAYRIAREQPELLAQLHCYCGCDKEYGHRNLLDCYRDRHGSRCEICIGEAIEAEKLVSQGSPIEQIRDSLRARFDRRE